MKPEFLLEEPRATQSVLVGLNEFATRREGDAAFGGKLRNCDLPDLDHCRLCGAYELERGL